MEHLPVSKTDDILSFAQCRLRYVSGEYQRSVIRLHVLPDGRPVAREPRGIDVGQRLIQNENFRGCGQGSSDRESGAFSFAKLVRADFGTLGKIEGAEQFLQFDF